MANRYQYSNSNIPRWDGKQVYKSTTYPIITPQDSDIIIISNESTMLDSLAFKYYSDCSYWWIIALANNLGSGRLSIRPGLTLRIPTNISGILNQMKQLNS